MKRSGLLEAVRRRHEQASGLDRWANEAHAEKKAAALEAVRDGVPVAEVAQACAVARKTVYRWLKEALAEEQQ